MDQASSDAPPAYGWLVAHRRVVVAVLCGVGGLVSLLLSWRGVANTVIVPDQLTYIASGGLLGLFLVAVAGMAYWGEQRQRELERLAGIERYLGAVAGALGLTEAEGSGAEIDASDATVLAEA